MTALTFILSPVWGQISNLSPIEGRSGSLPDRQAGTRIEVRGTRVKRIDSFVLDSTDSLSFG